MTNIRDTKNLKLESSIWGVAGKDKNYEYCRVSSHYSELRNWVDELFTKNNLARFLDPGFLHELRNNDFYARLWELELAGWFHHAKFKMIPTNGTGPDFCIELSDGRKVWVEAVLSRPNETLTKKDLEIYQEKLKAYEVPQQEIALMYTSSLARKAVEIKKKYCSQIGKSDYILIAVSAFTLPNIWSDIDLFMPSVLPIEFGIAYFNKDGSELDDTPRPTHTTKREYVKPSGETVPKEFLYPGSYFPYIDGVLFSEASNLQQLLGTQSSSFSESTKRPHLFQNYAGKIISEEFTQSFYYHRFDDTGKLLSINIVEPTI